MTPAYMEPNGDSTYRRAARDGGDVLQTSFDYTVAFAETMTAYETAIADLPPTCTGPGVSGTGLFFDLQVGRYQPIIQYTGNRVSGEALFEMEQRWASMGEIRKPSCFWMTTNNSSILVAWATMLST